MLYNERVLEINISKIIAYSDTYTPSPPSLMPSHYELEAWMKCLWNWIIHKV